MSDTPQKEGAGGEEERENIRQEAISTCRELIQRYSRCAVAVAPLLLFVSKAQAIHSKP